MSAFASLSTINQMTPDHRPTIGSHCCIKPQRVLVYSRYLHIICMHSRKVMTVLEWVASRRVRVLRYCDLLFCGCPSTTNLYFLRIVTAIIKATAVITWTMIVRLILVLVSNTHPILFPVPIQGSVDIVSLDSSQESVPLRLDMIVSWCRAEQ